jgi:hypothetical protein
VSDYPVYAQPIQRDDGEKPATCRCRRRPEGGSCGRAVTQEDLLCDVCRDGCIDMGDSAHWQAIGTTGGFE